MSYSIDTSRNIMRNPDIVSSDMDGETVMMSVEHGKYFGLTGIGPLLWDYMESPVSCEAMIQKILDKYEVDEATCRSDLVMFIGQLLESDIVKYGDEVP